MLSRPASSSATSKENKEETGLKSWPFQLLTMPSGPKRSRTTASLFRSSARALRSARSRTQGPDRPLPTGGSSATSSRHLSRTSPVSAPAASSRRTLPRMSPGSPQKRQRKRPRKSVTRRRRRKTMMALVIGDYHVRSLSSSSSLPPHTLSDPPANKTLERNLIQK